MNPLLKLFRVKIYTAVLLLILLVVVGVIGFMLTANYTFVDALYMTVITISTVGYKEVQHHDVDAKLFTISLIIFSVVILGYAITVITEYILSKNDLNVLKQKKMQKKIDGMSNHIIICGYGRNGKQAAQKLLAYKKPFVIIEKDKEIIEKFQSELIPFIFGNANEDEVLIQKVLNEQIP